MLMCSLLPTRVFFSLPCVPNCSSEWECVCVGVGVCVCVCVLTVVDILQLGRFVHVDIDAPRVDQDN